MIKKDNKLVCKIYDGENTVERIYKGTDKVYEYLPLGYIECEYISSTGTQWIDTGVSLRNATINITFKFNMATSTSQILLNCTPSTVGWFGLTSARKISLDGKNFDVVYNDKHNFILKYNNGVVTATDENGTIKQSTYSTSATGNFMLFNEWDNRKRFPSYARLYSVKVYEGNNIIRNFIPCLDNNATPCLYDLVSKQTFYNQGTGTFDYKIAKLPTGYRQCVYIESTDGAYVNILFIPNNYNGNYTLEMVAQHTTLPTNTQYLCGVGTSAGRSCNIEITSARRITCYIGSSSAVVAGRTTLTEEEMLQKNTYKAIMRNNAKCYFYINGTDYSTNKTATTTSSLEMTLFDSRSVAQRGFFKMYSCKIWDVNNKLIRFLIPALDSNNKPCLYDMLTKQTFYNRGANTTDFLYQLVQ